MAAPQVDVQSLIKKALEQGDDIALLLDTVAQRLAERRDATDRILHFLQDSYAFTEGANTAQGLVFNVPSGHAFEAARLMVFPEIRSVTIDPSTTGPDDLVYRPTAWISAGSAVFGRSAADAFIELSYVDKKGNPRTYQNKPFTVAQCFSSPLNVNARGIISNLVATFAPYAANQYGCGLVFDPFLEVEPGSAINMMVTPMYSGPSGASRIFEYRIRGVVEGYKRVRR